MLTLYLASWETLAQITINWTGDINFGGFDLALIVYVWVRLKR